MPSKTKKQARLMAASAHDAGFAKRVGVPQRSPANFIGQMHVQEHSKESGKTRIKEARVKKSVSP